MSHLLSENRDAMRPSAADGSCACSDLASHKKFADKYNLPFILVSDPELAAIRAYDVWKEKKLYGKVSMGVVRATYIIDENGVIEKVYPKVKPDTNAGEILEYLDQAAGN